MKIRVHRLSLCRVGANRRLFADEIDSDEWVIFHGTSGFNAESIERNGFDPMSVVVSFDQIRRVVALFKRLNWCEGDPGGYAILMSFSLKYDFQASDRSPLFLAETSMRALLYATRDFSGGEKLRSLRRAFDDLNSYLNDPRVREQHGASLEASYNEMHLMGFDAPLPEEVDLDLLREDLADLSDVRRIANDALLRHDHGVVYALRFREDDVENLRWNPSMGIEATARIAPATIVGKVIVPADYEMSQPSRLGEDFINRIDRGLIAVLQAKNRQRET